MLIALLGLNALGCTLFHHSDSPQQQFMDALNHGNSAQASQLWLHMDADDRANLSHNAGFRQDVNQDNVARAMLKHQQEVAAQNGDDQDAAGADGDSGVQQSEIPASAGDPNAAGLSGLPGAATMRQTPSIATIPVQ